MLKSTFLDFTICIEELSMYPYTTVYNIFMLSYKPFSLMFYPSRATNFLSHDQRLQSNLKKYYTEWGKIHSILVLHKSIINEEEKNAK